MSPEADVAFMVNACDEIASARSRGPSMQQKVDAVMKALRVSENRAYEFLKGKARRVDGFEKDRARAIKAEIEAENANRKRAEHIEWLRSTIEHLREENAGVDSHEVAHVERVLARIGALDSPMGDPH